MFTTKTKKIGAVQLLSGLAMTTSVLLAGGCGAGSQFVATNSTAGPLISGQVMGGRQPIANSNLTVWQVGGSGYGSAATVLATTTSDSGGNFGNAGHSFGAYSCPTTTPSQLYITAAGGNPGNPVNANPDILLVAPLGACPGEQSAQVIINEVSTAATVFALSGFIDPTKFGTGTGNTVGTTYPADAIGTTYNAAPSFAANNNNVTGLTNAFATLGTLITQYGVTPGSNSNATVDYQKINTLANVLANCVNSDPTNGDTNCSTLFADVSTTGSTTAANTFEAAYYMNTNPTDTVSGTSNIATVYSLVPTHVPYSPALTATPTDWTIGVNYAVSGLTGGQRIAMDGLGNAWVTGTGQVSQISPAGGIISFTGTPGTVAITSPFGVAADLNGNILVTDSGVNTIFQFTNAGTYVGSIAGSTTAGMEPYAIAFDKNNKAWLTETTSTAVGQTIGIDTGCGYTGGVFCTTVAPVAGNSGGEGAFAMALDKNNTIWTPLRYQTFTAGPPTTSGAIRAWAGGANGTGTSNNYAYGTTANGKAYFPTGLGFDASGNMWYSNTAYAVSGSTTYGSATGSYITKAIVTYASSGPPPVIDTLGAATTATNYTGGGLNAAMFMGIDGNSSIWVANSGANNSAYSVSEFANSGAALSPATTGYVHTMAAPNDLAIDASGNVWVVSNGAAYVTEIVGAAGPTVVPTVLNTTYGTWGKKP